MKRLIKKLIGLIVLILICIFGFYAAIGYTMYTAEIKEQSIESRIEKIRSQENYTPLSSVPDIYKKAVIAVEDSRFYRHGGVDIVALMRALVANIREKEFVQGGSTITQQFAKNLLFSHKQSISRKAAELFATYYIEKNYEKDEILELYMNVIYYGDGYYNLHDASYGYFGVLPEQMNDYQATLLAGVPNAPSIYAPTKNPELARKRQEKVLERMVETDAINEDQKNKILDDIQR